MEDFLQANRIVEISLSKLSTRSSGLPLRKTLFITQVLNRAQDMATSVQDYLLSSPNANSTRSTSKLLASFGQNESNITDDLPASQLRMLKPSSRQQSPIAIQCRDGQVAVAPHLKFGKEIMPHLQSNEEPMDFNNVTSFLGDILDSDNSLSHAPDLQQHVSNTGLPQSSSWGDNCLASDVIRPVSPGKRNYQQAFPFAARSPEEELEDLKRFKFSLEACALDSLPSFCGYLSSKNLQTAPFITYMFGRGFTHPSNPDSNTSDWPATRTGHMALELIAPLKNLPILAF